MARRCVGDGLKLCLWCSGDILEMVRWWSGDVLLRMRWFSFGDVLVMWWRSICDVLVLFWRCVGDIMAIVLVICWWCVNVGDDWVMCCWWYALAMRRWCIGYVVTLAIASSMRKFDLGVLRTMCPFGETFRIQFPYRNALKCLPTFMQLTMQIFF